MGTRKLTVRTTISVFLATLAMSAIPGARAQSVQPAAPAQSAAAKATEANSASPATTAPENSGSVAKRNFPAVRQGVRREVPPPPRRVVKKRQPAEAATQSAGSVPAATPPSAIAAPLAGPVAGVVAAGGATAAAKIIQAAPDPAPAAPVVGWSAEEIKQAKAHCDGLLKSINASYTVDDPIKQGECGSPVVYKLTSIGKGPEVQIHPPAVMTCEMIVGLDQWVKQDIQPRARALLGGSVVRIETMSSYSCRNAYGRARTRLSEHGRANALDISGFTTAKDTTTVLASWGATARELRAIAARQEAEKAAAQAAAQEAANRARKILPPGVVILHPPSASQAAPATPSLGIAPTRLGGPKAQGAAAPIAIPADAAANAKSDSNKRAFLRDVHARACKHFGTVLGPEANNAHKNHFHVDMAPRRTGNFCE